MNRAAPASPSKPARDRWWRPPRFPGNPELVLRANILGGILLAFVIGLVVYGMVTLTLRPHERLNRFTYIAGFFGAFSVVWFLIRKRLLNAAGVLVLVILWGLVTLSMLQGGGLMSPAFPGYLIIEVTAALIFGYRGAMICASFLILSTAGIYLYPEATVRPAQSLLGSVAYNGRTEFAAMSAFLIVTAALVGNVVMAMNRARRRSTNALEDRLAYHQALMRHRSQLDLTLEATRTGSWQWDLDTGRVVWSSNTESLFGLEKGAFRGTLDAWLDLTEPEDRPRIEKAFGSIIDDSAAFFSVEHRTRLPSGEIRWFELRAQAEVDVAGRNQGLRGVVMDITERKRGEEGLRESEERFRVMAAAAYEGILIHRQGIVLEVNPALSRMLGYAREELLGQDAFNRLVVPDDRDALRRHSMEGRDETLEIRVRHKDGRLLEIETRGTAILFQGQAARAAVLRDVTEIKESVARLEHLAYHDPLTGLPNRKMLQARVQGLGTLLERGAPVSSSSIWTASRRSTTPWGTPWAIRCCASSPRACWNCGTPRAPSSVGWGGTSSRSISRGTSTSANSARPGKTCFPACAYRCCTARPSWSWGPASASPWRRTMGPIFPCCCDTPMSPCTRPSSGARSPFTAPTSTPTRRVASLFFPIWPPPFASRN
jgi:PAS domain S-box-containing protein